MLYRVISLLQQVNKLIYFGIVLLRISILMIYMAQRVVEAILCCPVVAQGIIPQLSAKIVLIF